MGKCTNIYTWSSTAVHPTATLLSWHLYSGVHLVRGLLLTCLFGSSNQCAAESCSFSCVMWDGTFQLVGSMHRAVSMIFMAACGAVRQLQVVKS